MYIYIYMYMYIYMYIYIYINIWLVYVINRSSYTAVYRWGSMGL